MKQATLVQCIVAQCLLFWSSVIQALVVDHPFFRVLGVVIVWTAHSGNTTGSIAQQSVKFTAKYALFRNNSGSGGYALSMDKGHIETDVTYMIYVP